MAFGLELLCKSNLQVCERFDVIAFALAIILPRNPPSCQSHQNFNACLNLLCPIDHDIISMFGCLLDCQPDNTTESCDVAMAQCVVSKNESCLGNGAKIERYSFHETRNGIKAEDEVHKSQY
jgi:hypothetical protein